MTSQNTVKTVFLMGLLMALFAVLGAVVGGSTGMFYAIIFGGVSNLIAWFFSDSLALSSQGAKELSVKEAPQLHNLVDRIAKSAGIPKPRVYLIQSPMVNAFATGRSPENGAVAVTTGILQALTQEELAGVIAHEIAHIRNRDTLIATIAATVAGAITSLAQMAQWMAVSQATHQRQQSKDNSSATFALIASLLMVFLAPIAAAIIQMAISRSREYAADEDGARFLGNPEPLASALEKIERSVANAVPRQLNPSMSHLYIINPLKMSGLQGLFRTHPPTRERIARLRSLRF